MFNWILGKGIQTRASARLGDSIGDNEREYNGNNNRIVVIIISTFINTITVVIIVTLFVIAN